MSVQLPNCFILGSQKCGTTTLAHLLESHPEITLGHTKEFNTLGMHDEADRMGRYKSWIKPEAKIRIDASPAYLFTEASLQRIAELSDDQTRFLIILREPAARTLSAYWHFHSHGIDQRTLAEAFSCFSDIDTTASSNRSPLQQAIAREAHLLRSHVIEGRVNVHRYYWRAPDPLRPLQYLANSDFHSQLQRVFTLLGRQRVMILFNDDLKADQTQLAQRVAEFLGLDPAAFTPGENEVRSNVRQVPKPGWKANTLRQLKELIPASVRKRVPSNLTQLYRSNTYGRPPKADTEIEAKVKQVFADEYGKLSELIQRELPATWTTREA